MKWPGVRITTVGSLSHFFGATEFSVFKNALESGGTIAALVFKGGAAYSRKHIDELTDHVKRYHAKGLVWLVRVPSPARVCRSTRRTARGPGNVDASRAYAAVAASHQRCRVSTAPRFFRARRRRPTPGSRPRTRSGSSRAGRVGCP